MWQQNGYALLLTCFTILYIGMSGCTRGTDDQLYGNEAPAEVEDLLSSVFVQDKTVVQQTNEKERNPFLKKIWVASGADIATYTCPSFFITKMENGIVDGKLSKRSVAEPDCYVYRFDSAKNLYALTGVFNNGAAECQIIGDGENIGEITLVFGDNEIKATIEFYNNGEDAQLSGEYRFRPYNLSDIGQSITILKLDSFSIEMNTWGKVNFVTALLDTGHVWYPAAYLTNEKNDILYHFSTPFQSATEITDVVVEDLNGDGLKDVRIINCFIDYDDGSVLHDMPFIERVFFQMEDGLFYDSSLE